MIRGSMRLLICWAVAAGHNPRPKRISRHLVFTIRKRIYDCNSIKKGRLLGSLFLQAVKKLNYLFTTMRRVILVPSTSRVNR